jgi:hypothetical protein
MGEGNEGQVGPGSRRCPHTGRCAAVPCTGSWWTSVVRNNTSLTLMVTRGHRYKGLQSAPDAPGMPAGPAVSACNMHQLWQARKRQIAPIPCRYGGRSTLPLGLTCSIQTSPSESTQLGQFQVHLARIPHRPRSRPRALAAAAFGARTERGRTASRCSHCPPAKRRYAGPKRWDFRWRRPARLSTMSSSP